jgi:hypothetical protein
MLQLLRECPLLRIEDLLPLFPDFVLIDDFKEQICAALEEYADRPNRAAAVSHACTTRRTSLQVRAASC